jgi:hypothetical protein
MGQEWSADSPFLFFTHHTGDLGQAISHGRRKEFAQAGLNTGVKHEEIPDPEEFTTFVRSKLDWRELDEPVHRSMFSLYREALRARKVFVEPAVVDREYWAVAVAGPAVVVRYAPPHAAPSLLLVTFTAGQIDTPDPYPLLKNSPGHRWKLELQSESPQFGGHGRLSGYSISAESADPAWLTFKVAGAILLVEEKA